MSHASSVENPPLVIGLDLGTGGARALICNRQGAILGSGSAPLSPPRMDESGCSEQDAGEWLTAAEAALGRALCNLEEKGYSRRQVVAVCVDGTSGTVVFLDHDLHPVAPGWLHNDTRAQAQALELNQCLSHHVAEVGYQFGATFALAKILYFRQTQPVCFQRVHLIEHQADYILGWLIGRHGISDPSNALKTGYNLVQNAWPPELDELGFAHLLPTVIPSGELAGTLAADRANRLGLSTEVRVYTGVTDSTAAFLATGACQEGEFAVSLGTTLAFKGVSASLVHDPKGTVYCHRLPNGKWLPGAASNVGGACLKKFFKGKDLAELDRSVLRHFPTPKLCYPLVEVGERFPFGSSIADGFYVPYENEEEQYLSLLQGVGLVEKWCFEEFDRLGIPVASTVYTAGGGSESDTWCKLRAHILQKRLARCRTTDSAFGVAVLAAAAEFYQNNLELAQQSMTAVSRYFEPDRRHATWANDALVLIKKECLRRGWLD